MKINYDCEELIKELKKDIEEFGNIDMYAFFNKQKVKVPFQNKIIEITILINYDFISEEKPLICDELDNSIVQVMKASEILKILEKQNNII